MDEIAKNLWGLVKLLFELLKKEPWTFVAFILFLGTYYFLRFYLVNWWLETRPKGEPRGIVVKYFIGGFKSGVGIIIWSVITITEFVIIVSLILSLLNVMGFPFPPGFMQKVA